jgi:phosphate acyltransferase
MKIALDAMGGDFGTLNNIAGLKLALEALPQLEHVYLVGQPAALEAELAKQDLRSSRISIVEATQVVDMADSGLDAVRRKKDSSISRAVDLVKSGQAQAVVSAGHTGAAVTAATIKLRTIPGVERPAITTVMPSMTHKWLLIDAGANPDSEPQHLLQNAIMGTAYARHILGRKEPTVGLMSNGTEEDKGNLLTKEAANLLRSATGIHFKGNVEGHDLWSEPPDVVVCDGFTGNIILKTSEALAHAFFDMVKEEVSKSLVYKIGAQIARPAFRNVKRKTSADEVGGMPLLGLNGTVIISHGSASPTAMKNAIRQACESIQQQVNPFIEQAIAASLAANA